MSGPSMPRPERRRGVDRRKSTFRSLIYGSFKPRRRGPRREHEHSFTSVDWHHPKWLAVALLILVLSCTDAVLTVTLISHGAIEINPVMAALLERGGVGFSTVKIGLTAGCTVLLVLLAGVRAFGRVPVSLVLYGVLAAYVMLVAYELWLLDRIAHQ